MRGVSRKHRKILWRIIAAAAVFAAVVCMPLKGWLRFAAFLIPYGIIGWDVLFKAGKNILRGRVFDENFLMGIATVGALAIGEYPEAVAVMLFYQVGELFQKLAVGKSRRSIAELMDIRPDTAFVLRDGSEIELPPEEVAVEQAVQADAQTMQTFSEEEQQMINAFSEQIDIRDTNLVFSYGAAAQQNISQFSDAALKNVQTKYFLK